MERGSCNIAHQLLAWRTVLASWYSRNLGDALLAGALQDDLLAAFEAGCATAGQTGPLAIFQKHISEAQLHCELIIYFTPAAGDIALALGARPCARPSRDGLGLLAGKPEAWGLFNDA